MKLNEITNQHAEIEALLIKYKIENYAINSDGTVDVAGIVSIEDKGGEALVTRLPINFGHVSGNFFCKFRNLTSIEGMPLSIGGWCHIGLCTKLSSLEGFTTKIAGSLYFNGGTNIKTGGISLMLSGAHTLSPAYGPFEIIEAYLGRPDDIFECQAELIAAGYEAYARL